MQTTTSQDAQGFTMRLATSDDDATALMTAHNDAHPRHLRFLDDAPYRRVRVQTWQGTILGDCDTRMDAWNEFAALQMLIGK